MLNVNQLLAVAAGEIGTHEEPPNSNAVKYNTAFYGREISGGAYPWCCAFVWWVFQQTGSDALFYGGQKTASCTELYRYYQRQKRTVPAKEARPGDLVFFTFDGNKQGILNHIGICESCADGYVTTIDGNTGVGNDANGGAVMRRKRALSYVGGVSRPDDQEDSMTTEQFEALYNQINPLYTGLDQVPEYWRAETESLMKAGAIQGDGVHPISLRKEQLQAVVINKRYEDHK